MASIARNPKRLFRPVRWLQGLLGQANHAHASRRSARRLEALGDHELADIGLTRADAEMLARNPDVLPDRLRR
ncbi:MAG: DUF1127 domain-containing protein [Amaricoccus sp.]|uniref:DUF1127 domain-containing protein n=1 Tax=Amaricoccus sp. TaxID=1872485 RepID=UPI0039E6C325